MEKIIKVIKAVLLSCKMVLRILKLEKNNNKKERLIKFIKIRKY